MMELLEGQSWVFEMVNNILIEVMGTIAEQERLTIKQRQAEGIAAAKTKGKKFGRPAMKKTGNIAAVYDYWRTGEINARQAIETLGMKASYFYKLVRAVENR